MSAISNPSKPFDWTEQATRERGRLKFDDQADTPYWLDCEIFIPRGSASRRCSFPVIREEGKFMNWVRHFRSLLSAVLALLVTGCAGDGGPTYYTVTGQVTFESEAVSEGSIIFMC